MLRWQWDKKIGEWVERDYHDENKKWTYNMYECNGLFVVLHEFKNEEGQEQYQMHSFACDVEHLRNMLGTAKGYNENCYNRLCEIKLHMDYKVSQTIIKEIIKADFTEPVKITIIPKAPF